MAYAQRLSASKIGTPATVQFRRLETTCSTPFGIKDRNTCPPRITLKANPYAQRLSASKIGTHEGGVHQGVDAGMLNAFRHQRSEHLVQFPFQRARCRMLNAFRHQRSEHAECRLGRRREKKHAQRLSASKIGTPRSSPCTMSLDLMLNAFRHQRSEHL